MAYWVTDSLPSFARGLHVLLVDHNPIFLAFMASMLQNYSYKVTTTQLAPMALSIIQEQNHHFDLVIADVEMPDMDIFSFLQLLRNIIPVILISSVKDLKMAVKCLAEGASYFLEKPLLKEDIKYLWQHVCRKKKHPRNLKIDKANSGKRPRDIATREEDMQVVEGELKRRDDPEGQSKNKRMKMKTRTNAETVRTTEEEEDEHSYDSICVSTKKKSRVVWSAELRLRFIEVLSRLDDKKVRPKTILKMMNDPSLTRRQVANHLQKYKAQVQRINRKDESKIHSIQQHHGTSEIGPSSWNCAVGVELHQLNASDCLHIPSLRATTHFAKFDLQTRNENMENREDSSDSHSYNATTKSIELQHEAYAEKQHSVSEEIKEFGTNSTPENQILRDSNAGTERADVMGGGKIQPLKQFADMVKVLEGNSEELNCLGSEHSFGNDVDRYCEWLRENILEDQTILNS